MSNSQAKPEVPYLIGVAAAYLQPHVAFASVGAGAGLPYEDTFAKIVTSLTGPWAWTVSVVCIVIYAYNAIQRGGDLGGSTTAFLGPAFLCTLLLGAKKLMAFFGQGAMLTTPASMVLLGGAFALGIIVGLMMLAPLTFQLYRSYRRRALAPAKVEPAAAQLATDSAQLLLFTPRHSGKSLMHPRPKQPPTSELLSRPRHEISKEN